jgi:hypothetical protein
MHHGKPRTGFPAHTVFSSPVPRHACRVPCSSPTPQQFRSPRNSTSSIPTPARAPPSGPSKTCSTADDERHYHGGTGLGSLTPPHRTLEATVKKSFLVLIALLLSSVASSQTPEKNVLSTYRIVPATGKDAALKKAIAAHAAKYHTGTWKWRVFSVLSGPDEGAYMINEGPNSWTDNEGRKDLSDEHTRDYETTILPLVEKTLPAAYLTFDKDLSSDSGPGSFKKALLRHFYLKPGRAGRLSSHFAVWKKVDDKLGLKVTVWRSFYSGQPRIVAAIRLTNGWTDLERSIGKEMREAYDEIAGTGAFGRYLEDLDQSVDRIDEEMIEFLPDLSSK